MGTLQVFQQLLGTLLLGRQLLHQRVVLDVGLHLTVLGCEVLVLFLHLLFVQRCQLLHVLVGLLLLHETVAQPAHNSKQRYNDNRYNIFVHLNSFSVKSGAKLTFFCEKAKKSWKFSNYLLYLQHN